MRFPSLLRTLFLRLTGSMSRSPTTADSDDSTTTETAEVVSQEDVRHLADLARLDVEEGRLEALTGDLRRLLDYAQQLGEVDTAGVEPMPPGAPAVPQRLRPDEAREPLSQEDALENAPDPDEGFFRTPQAIQ
jgi:aspartyl-tRNA(Asn)/glutamyl-tRNA(Gln) amidotransferase subunit C